MEVITYPLAPHPLGFRIRISELQLHCEPSSLGVPAKEAILGFGAGRLAHAQSRLITSPKGSLTATVQPAANEHSLSKVIHQLQDRPSPRSLSGPSSSHLIEKWTIQMRPQDFFITSRLCGAYHAVEEVGTRRSHSKE